MHALHDLFDRLAGGRDLHAHRVVQVGVGDFLNILGHGGREQQGLAPLRDVLGDFAQGMDKAHV